MKPLSRLETDTILLLAENNFVISNVALDMNCSPSAISARLAKIREIASDLFVYYKPKGERSNKTRIYGFSGNGYRFYEAAKYFKATLEDLEFVTNQRPSDIMEIK